MGRSSKGAEDTVLVVTADDYALSRAVSAGIRVAFSKGIVTATSVLANVPRVQDELIMLVEECPGLGIGVHLNLTYGMPLLRESKLSVGCDGRFPSSKIVGEVLGSVSPRAVRDEWKAQMERCLESGITLDHINSHHHVAYATQDIAEIYVEIAHEYAIPARRPPSRYESQFDVPTLLGDSLTSDKLIDSFRGRSSSFASFRRLINGLKPGVTELLCHPGMVSQEIGDSFLGRERDLEIVGDEAILRYVKGLGVRLSSFRGAFL